MKRGKAVQIRFISLSLQAVLACTALTLAQAVEAAPYYDADVEASSNLGVSDSDYVFSTTRGVYSSATSGSGHANGYASASAGPGHLGAYAHTSAAGALGFASATGGASFVLSDLIFSSSNPSSTQVVTSLNFSLGGNIWGGHNPGSNMHSRGSVGIGWRLNSGGVTYLSADGSLSYWSSDAGVGIQPVQATGVLADLTSMPPGYTWSYTPSIVLGQENLITLSNITLDIGRAYELTAWIVSDVASGYSPNNDGNTTLGVNFGNTMSFPTSGAVFNLPEGFSLNSADGAIVNNQWIDPRPAVVPVPAAVWLFGSGLLGLIGVARRTKKQKATG